MCPLFVLLGCYCFVPLIPLTAWRKIPTISLVNGRWRANLKEKGKVKEKIHLNLTTDKILYEIAIKYIPSIFSGIIIQWNILGPISIHLIREKVKRVLRWVSNKRVYNSIVFPLLHMTPMAPMVSRWCLDDLASFVFLHLVPWNESSDFNTRK
jgi:hypothetical protein